MSSPEKMKNFSVKVKGGIKLRNGMWQGLRNDIVMRNVIHAEWPKVKSAPCFGANQSANTAVEGSTYDDNRGHEGSLSISTATKILLAFISRVAWQHRYHMTKVVHWRKDVLEGHTPFYFNFFCKRCLHDQRDNWVCVFFSFLSLPTVLAFFTIKRTHSHKEAIPPFTLTENFFGHITLLADIC